MEDPLYNVTLYNSKILYTLQSLYNATHLSIEIAKLSNYSELVFITTAFQFNIKILGDKFRHCKEGWLY